MQETNSFPTDFTNRTSCRVFWMPTSSNRWILASCCLTQQGWICNNLLLQAVYNLTDDHHVISIISIFWLTAIKSTKLAKTTHSHFFFAALAWNESGVRTTLVAEISRWHNHRAVATDHRSYLHLHFIIN